jgi:bifunctional DNA-binding transcriptional regulator/antitoxin component of YhaV-PrlF toxin-antitoxin module
VARLANKPIYIQYGGFLEQVYHVKLGDSHRLAVPAALCRKLGFKPGEQLLLTQNGHQLAISSLRQQAEQMREELREILTKGQPLTADLKKLRKAEAAREADPR